MKDMQTSEISDAMGNDKPEMTFSVSAHRIDTHGSEVSCKDGRLVLDTDMKGRHDAFNPAELLLAALSACIIKGIERVTPMLNFSLQTVEVSVNGIRQDAPPKMKAINYIVIIDTEESDRRLELLHENIRKYGTVFNTIAPGTRLSGTVKRKQV